jgi:hypothetical protein
MMTDLWAEFWALMNEHATVRDFRDFLCDY